MESDHLKLKFKMKRNRNCKKNSVCYTSNSFVPSTPQNFIDLSAEDDIETEDVHSSQNANMQLVLYEPPEINSVEIVAVNTRSKPRQSRRHSFPGQTPRVLPAVGAFTVQCANCFKWRLIPTEEKYEEIRAHILNRPFLCETAREWKPSISCDAEPDIEQDSSRLWAIDKPSIAQPPRGWQRLLRIRGEGSTKFADVYYQSPKGKILRSMVEIEKYLQKHTEYTEAGVNMKQFSFQTPKPLQETYVRKRPAPPATFPEDGGGSGIHRFNQAAEVPALTWSVPDEDTNLHLGGPDSRPTYRETLASGLAKRKKTPSKKS